MDNSDTNFLKCFMFTTTWLLWLNEIIYQSKIGSFLIFGFVVFLLLLYIINGIHIEKQYYILAVLQAISIICRLFLLKSHIIGSVIFDISSIILIIIYAYKIFQYLRPNNMSKHKLYVLEEEDYKNED